MHHLLDDPGFVTRLDPKGMYDLTLDFPAQCRRALEIARAAELQELNSRPSVAMLSGLGGSAAGGDLIRALFESYGSVPFLVNRDYTIPHFVGLGDLVFSASYSGNTEETLSAYQAAKKSGAHIVCITSGGKLAEAASEDKNAVIAVPGQQPPRTALGYMCLPVLFACEQFRLLQEQDYESAFARLDDCASQWTMEVPFAENEAKQIAAHLHGAVGMIYGLGGWQAIVANRWKGQINENAKNLAFANGYPELDHNEILGWVGADRQGVARWAGVLLKDGTEGPKMQARAEATERSFGDKASFMHVRAGGESLLERIFSLVYLGDFVSLYLAALNEVDPHNMDAIENLKAELAKLN